MDAGKDGLIAETVRAWKYGPVIPSLRDEFREFGPYHINRKANDYVGWGEEFVPELAEYEPEEWELRLLEWVYRKYGHLSGPALIDLTHRPGAPWHQVTEGGKKAMHSPPIPNPVIREHYEELLRGVSK